MAAKRKARPTDRKRERPGEYVGFRSPPALKTKLEEVARAAGRSLSSEAQFRLEKSFEREPLALDALDLAFGRPIAGIALLIASCLRTASLRASHKLSASPALPGDEISNPQVRREALLCARAVIDWLAERTDPTGASNIGEVVGAGFTDWLEKGAPPSNSELANISERLDPLLKTVIETVTMVGQGKLSAGPEGTTKLSTPKRGNA